MENQKYEDLLIGFAELLKEKKSELFFKQLDVERAERKLEQAERRIRELEGEQLQLIDVNT